jgi:WhiB family redox-sensing transcriptional regulator
MTATAWQDRGACADRPELFFGPDEEATGTMRVRERKAKRICARCPVVAECLAAALERREQYGVWGGIGQAELRRRTKIGGGKGWARGRLAETCRRGHSLKDGEGHVRINADGTRRCATCYTAAANRRQAKTRGAA